MVLDRHIVNKNKKNHTNSNNNNNNNNSTNSNNTNNNKLSDEDSVFYQLYSQVRVG